MGTSKLGMLESANLREAWEHEAHDFTPWLAENLDRLATELGIKLEYEDREVYVGPYRADIVARDPRDDSTVLIENQLEGANLQHLGQVLAYLAGLKAETIVWIAKDFEEAHLSAIRWLNEHTDDPFAFFAVRVGVVKIGDSPLAPIFDVLEQPNNWDRRVKEVARSGDLSERGQFRREFWAHVNEKYPGEVKRGYAHSNVYHQVREANLRVGQYIAQRSVGVYLTGQRGESGETVAARIGSFLEPLHDALDGEELFDHWDGSSTVMRIDTSDRANWDRMADWLHERRVTYERVLRENSD